MDIIKIRQEIASGKSIYDLNLRVVDYDRVSTEKEEQLNSLVNQANYFKEMIEGVEKWNHVGSYTDEGISGTQVFRREDFLRMIEDARLGKFDMIVTKEISRFARNTIDSIKYTQLLLSYGVIVFFVSDNINTINPDSEFRLTLMSSLAQDEVRKLSSRVKFGLARSVKDGKVLGGGNITGYYKEKGRLYIKEDEAEIIRLLFDLYATGKYGFRAIAEMLFEKGYKNSKGERYADRVLCRMLCNPKYKGFYCGNISYIEDYKTHRKIKRPKEEWIVYRDPNIPAIVSEEIWDKANEIHNKRGDKYETPISRRSYYDDRYTYTGKLVCKEHGCTFGRNGTGQRKNNPVYQCLKYHKGGLKDCSTPTLFEKHLDEIFKAVIKEFIKNKDLYIKEILEDYKKFIKNNDVTKKIEKIKEKNEKIKDLKNKLLELSLEGCISNEEFKQKNNDYNEEMNNNNVEISKFENSISDISVYEEKINELKKSLDKKLKFENSYKDLFNLIIKRVYVSKINNDRKHIKFEIEFNFDMKMKEIIIDFNNEKKRFDSENKFRALENRKALKCHLSDSNGPRCISNTNTTNNSSISRNKWRNFI